MKYETKSNPREEEERLIVPFNTVTWPAASAITNWFDPIRVAATKYEGFNLAPATARNLLRFKFKEFSLKCQISNKPNKITPYSYAWNRYNLPDVTYDTVQ